MHRKTFARAAVVALAGTALVAGPASAATKTLTVKGGVQFKPGTSVTDNQRFAPRVLTVAKNDSVRIVNRSKAPDPHTISFLRKRELPRSFGDLEGPNSRTGGLLGQLMEAHGAGEGEEAPTNPFVIDFQGVAPSTALEVDGRGDSFFFIGKRGPTFKVTADKGSNLFYFCAIHPWMQGKIQVR